jgi:fibronectin type 3 domain-containing protein
MKKLFYFVVGFCLAALLLPVLSFGETLQWDACTDAEGYNIYFTDGTNSYNYNNGNQTSLADIETTLQLAFNVEYTFHVTSYNQAGESGPSNTVTFTRVGYAPPDDVLPGTTLVITGPVTITITP